MTRVERGHVMWTTPGRNTGIRFCPASFAALPRRSGPAPHRFCGAGPLVLAGPLLRRRPERALAEPVSAVQECEVLLGGLVERRLPRGSKWL